MDQTPQANLLSASYSKLVISHLMGLMRMLEARIAADGAITALSQFHSADGAEEATADSREVIDTLKEVSYPQFDSFRYLTEMSYLVYGTTLLDSFLSDTTKFLFLLFPSAMGKDLSVKLESVISATSREDLICLAATKKVREVSYLPFLSRIEFLSQTFGLNITLGTSTVERLEHYSTLRNVVIHDQSVFEVELEAGIGPTIVQKTCPRHPTPLTREDVKKAEHAYREVVSSVSEAVFTHVLKADTPFRKGFEELGRMYVEKAEPQD